MMIDEFRMKRRAEELTEDKEIKVKIPLDYHVRLHTVKVVKGQNISETVKAALAYYFAELAAANPVEVPPSGLPIEPPVSPFVRRVE